MHTKSFLHNNPINVVKTPISNNRKNGNRITSQRNKKTVTLPGNYLKFNLFELIPIDGDKG